MTGRVAIVTGGTGALGQAITGALLEAGATVAIPYAVAEERAALEGRLAPELRARLLPVAAHLTDHAAVTKFVQAVHERHGLGRRLVHAAGGLPGRHPAGTALAQSVPTMKL